MDESKVKQLEDKLRQLFATASQAQDEGNSMPRPVSNTRVIRRRKGQPDTKIA